jgi:hypothetical protein
MIYEEDNRILINCDCRCGRGFELIREEDETVIVSAISNNSFTFESIFCKLKTKLYKIWSIIRNKDYCYVDVVLTKEQFEEFKDAINKI